MSAGRRIAWSSTDRYSPVQDRAGVFDPADDELPPVSLRVNQNPSPYWPGWLDEREILRVTYQGDDRCNLRCPGCYTGERLDRPSIAPTAANERLRVPWEDFTGHLRGLGAGLQDFYLLGAEPTMDPEGSAAKLEHAAAVGLATMSITNGATSPARFDRTFGPALEAGDLYKVIVSLDSIDPAVNDALRGSAGAFRKTIATIERAVAQGVPVKVQVTVWPRNYLTVLETVRALWEMGVRGFAFHSGSVEGTSDFLAKGLDHLDPLAWRTLCERLYEFRDTHRDELVHFNFPLIYFTERELRGRVIGDDELADAYLTHVAAVEEGVDSTKPFHACPAMDVPQVYVYANDGPAGRGSVSLCNVHSPDSDAAFADYDPDSGRWRIVEDPARNQMQRMADSPHLCPAMPFATGGRSSDRVVTEAGALYHACRYLGCNQIATDQGQFGWTAWERSVEFYRAVEVLRAVSVRSGAEAVEPHLARVRRLGTGVPTLRDRTIAVLREAASLGAVELDAFPAEVVAAVGTSRRSSTVPLGLPVFVLGAPGGETDGAGAATPCGSCR
ncbi:MAG TPA: radical SAM protein [Mycobacteriales bacterium]|jgi:MoaA/NifB/PqqE/SkfB family radical SAM enzyme|nr:radical SAM protein [Mycobacteriales bacterium]